MKSATSSSLSSPLTEPRAAGGFAMVVVVTLIILLALIATGLLSLASVQLRSSTHEEDQQTAQANARLALSLAIAELQTFLGPDERVSAPAAILENGATVAHPHWTGVWSSRQEDGRSWWQRDDARGGLRDERTSSEWKRENSVLNYLVSGNEGGRKLLGDNLLSPLSSDPFQEGDIELVGRGTLGRTANLQQKGVRAPLVPLYENEDKLSERTGSYGFWVGDLGTRANIATANPWQESSDLIQGDRATMVSQELNTQSLTTGEEDEELVLSQSERKKLLSQGQLPLAVSPSNLDPLWHDLTVWSQGVLSDVRDGGLKKNLSVFLDGKETSAEGGAPVLQESDNLVGPRNEEHAEALGFDWESGRHRASSPTFGLLRDFAEMGVGREDQLVEMAGPETRRVDSRELGARSAMANDQAAKITERRAADLMPVLVEGSMYSTYSYHPNPSGFRKTFNIRTHVWPRAVLWNPYNVAISVPQTVLMLQLNTRNDFRTKVGIGGFVGDLQWISWGGGTRSDPPRQGEEITESENYNDPYSGMWFFSLPEQEIGPGECLVFSCEKAAEYDEKNVLNNRLSAEIAPDPSRNYYISSSEFDDDDSGSGFNFVLLDYYYHPAVGQENQGDDARMIWKDANGNSSVNIFDFDNLPQLQSVSCSLQYGAGKEPLIAWNDENRIPVEFTELEDPRITQTPDVRSREGFRLRWFEEHPSNTGVLNNPAGSRIFETAPLANWNPRAAYSIRNPWDNVGGDVGEGGTVGRAAASGPWFFGLYTRDLYDQAVSWQDQTPFFEDGLYRGNPFGTPQEGRLRNILFEIPREETGLLSLAQLQHAKLTDFVWHPSYAIANSLVDPRLSDSAMDRTSPLLEDEKAGGWNFDALGWSEDQERAEDRDEWARFARFIMQELPDDETLVYDLSYELNHSLWDEFFLSSGTREQRRDLIEKGEPLPNGRFKALHDATIEDVDDIEKSASALMLDGAFNVNSTSVEAWKALLASTRNTSPLSKEGRTAIPRMPNPEDGEWQQEDGDGFDVEAWSGYRSLSDDEISRLASEIVKQVRLRGPFLSLSDFVNRRLVQDFDGAQTGLMGPLQAAIEAAELNGAFTSDDSPWNLENEEALPDYDHPDNIEDATRLSQRLKPDSKAWGAPGYLTQADLLQVIGPVLTARSDTFIVRSYGDARDAKGRVTAKAWCEAIVQRVPEPIVADESGLNPDKQKQGGQFGRKFEVRSFRWLMENEV